MNIPHISEYQDPRILDLLGRIKALEAEMAEAMSKIVYLESKEGRAPIPGSTYGTRKD